jgi:succinate dehydrogenase hydrophobic anchor subunit
MMPSRTVRTVPRRPLTLEFSMWIFTRISGAALLLLGTIGMLGALYMGARTQMDLATLMRWTFFPNPNHVVNSNIPDVNLGWVSVYWRLMEYLIVFFGATHGFNGMRVVMEDYVHHETVRRVLRWVIVLLWVVVLAVAGYMISST